ncbi:lipid II:glycine glycyltransferase FemX, partial [Thermodesulfobacteriota bacterium]
MITKRITKSELLRLLSNPTLFQHPSWLNAIEEGLGYKCFGLLTLCKGIPSCLNIFFESRKAGFFKLAGSPLPGSFTPYLEPIWLEDMNDSTKIDVIIDQNEFLMKKGFSFIERRFNKTSKLFSSVNFQDFEISSPETYVLPVEGDEDHMWNNMKGRSRNMIRKAQKSGVVIREGKGSQKELREFYSMLISVFEKSGAKPPHPFSLYESIVKYLKPESRLLILLAKKEGRIISTGFFVHDLVEIHFLSGASWPEAYKTGANNLIQWHVIIFALQHNIKAYDLGGKGIKSIDKFKASFGGVTHNYLKLKWTTRIARFAEHG